jgi:hypothetical protein
MNFCIFVWVSMLPLWPHAVASGLRSKQVPYTGRRLVLVERPRSHKDNSVIAGSTDPDYPVWNIHLAERAYVLTSLGCAFLLYFLCAALDSLELERMSSSRRSYSRQLVALEEAHVANSDFAANTMTSTVAQIQARLCLLGPLCPKQLFMGAGIG